MATDPPGTCHLVGCPSKGRHSPHHQLPTLERPAHLATEKIHQEIAAAYEKAMPLPIGAPADFGPYIPPRADRCWGFPQVEPWGMETIMVRCSLAPSAWQRVVKSLSATEMAILVDEHKLECPYRAPR